MRRLASIQAPQRLSQAWGLGAAGVTDCAEAGDADVRKACTASAAAAAGTRTEAKSNERRMSWPLSSDQGPVTRRPIARPAISSTRKMTMKMKNRVLAMAMDAPAT